ncbi:hypothetical protein C9374_010829 [Naegleria lovaniensis]|uniref:Uncharacterized protein n=1 Tax=Naegleria lovaniensis TaxID=51637 RepID=A0AA88GF70_NAELO|nr:uncharacterized protein C9374_010829 [Naegleria lovaniensis]KAG2374259.1 hypothetical protein C9374_010829 [Naegleria lovaniensis]
MQSNNNHQETLSDPEEEEITHLSSSTPADNSSGQTHPLVGDDHDDAPVGSHDKDLGMSEEAFHDFIEQQVAKKRSNEPLSLKDKLSIWTIGILTFFVSIATILGTGILGLPVKLYQTGFWPFFSTFIICFIMQAMIILYLTEILQKTELIMKEEHGKKESLEEENIMQEKTSEQDVEDITHTNSNDQEEEEPIETIEQVGTTSVPVKEENKEPIVFEPDLHTIGRLFLNRVLQILFDFSVIIHFISILISYSIAGPIAIASLFNIKDYYPYFIPGFVLILTIFVLLLERFLSHIISAATIFKGALLLIMVGLVGFISQQTKLNFTDNFQYIGHPFLIGTVSLGGVMNTLPCKYSKIVRQSQPPAVVNEDEDETTEEMRIRVKALKIQIFRWSAILGLFVCFVINVLWCLFVLRIVPQESSSTDKNYPSLHKSKEKGEISTVPIIEIIKLKYPQYVWLGYFVQFFISLSITVSFCTMSAGAKHMLDGYVKTFEMAQQRVGSVASRFSEFLYSKMTFLKHKPSRMSLLLKIVLYGATFLPTYVMAQINPRSFLTVMEVFTSMALNLESGFFISLILLISCRARYSHHVISVPLPKLFIYATVGIVAAYFLFAVVFDIVYSIIGWAWPEKPF